MAHHHAGVHLDISQKIRVHSLGSSTGYIYFDRLAAIEFAKAIDRIPNRTALLDFVYTSFANSYQRQFGFNWNEDAYIHRIEPAILRHSRTSRGRDIYCIEVNVVKQYLPKDAELTWQVFYTPAEELDLIDQDIHQHLSTIQANNSHILQGIVAPSPVPLALAHGFPNCATFDPQQLNLPPYFAASPYINTPVRPSQDSLMDFHTPRPEPSVAQVSTSHTQSTDEATLVESGYTTPAERLDVQDFLDRECEKMDRQNNNHRPSLRDRFTSQFDQVTVQASLDKQAAIRIMHFIKVLAMNPHHIDKHNKHRFSISSEKQAISSMTINTSLNVGSAKRPIPDLTKILFTKYDNNDECGQESFHRGLLMVAVCLLRHHFMYESKGGKKEPGNYAKDFEQAYKLPAGYLQRARHLCRIVVACGSPCVIVVLVRLAIRDGVSLNRLLDQLPISHFCRFVASGKVTNINTDDDGTHANLQWMHINVFLPLLCAAHHRVPEDLALVGGTLKCNEDTCLQAIVHNSQQKRYAQFLAGNIADDQGWATGRIVLENGNSTTEKDREYSIEKNQRTRHHFKLSSYAQTEHFEPPPAFLQSATLPLGDDV